jgi:hypothetical protein
MTRKFRIALINLGAVVSAVLYFVCGCDYVHNLTVAFPSPLENVDFHSYSTLRWVTAPSQRIKIHLKQQSDIKQLVDLRVFGDFQPEITDDSAVSQFGKPIQTRTDEFGGTWSRYSTPMGYAEIGVDRRTSLPADDDGKVSAPGRRSLQAHTDYSFDKVFAPPLLAVLHQAKKITPRAANRDIDFFNSENRLVLNILIKNGRISHMELFRHVDR